MSDFVSLSKYDTDTVINRCSSQEHLRWEGAGVDPELLRDEKIDATTVECAYSVGKIALAVEE